VRKFKFCVSPLVKRYPGQYTFSIRHIIVIQFNLLFSNIYLALKL